MDQIINSTTGGVHTILALASMIFGALILFMPKATKRHKQIGYAYVVCMAGMIATSFFMYGLFGGFGIFHIASLFSAITLLGGMVPIWIKRPITTYKSFHFSFMYWSVIGLYAAFFSEVFTRVPSTPFFGMVGIATAVTCGLGALYFKKKKDHWQEVFGG